MRGDSFGILCAMRGIGTALLILWVADAPGAESQRFAAPFGLISPAPTLPAADHSMEVLSSGAPPASATVLQIDGLRQALGLAVAKHQPFQNQFCADDAYCAAAAAMDLALWFTHGEGAPRAAALTATELFTLAPEPAVALRTAEDAATTAAPAKVAPVSDTPARTAPAAPAPEPVQATAATPKTTADLQAAPLAPPTTPTALDAWWLPWLVGAALTLVLVLLPLFVLARRRRARTVYDLIHEFYRRVDLAKQHHARDDQAAGEQVAKAFDQLHEQARRLLDARTIRLADLQRAVLMFHSPDPSESTRWSPPTLSQLGYVLAAAEKLSGKTPVLALYKYSGEERGHGGTVVDTYTMFKEGDTAGFSEAFPAKVQSPFAIKFAAPDGSTAPSPADNTLGAAAETVSGHDTDGHNHEPGDPANSDYHLAYVLSLVEHDHARSITCLRQNLEALASTCAAPNAEATSSVFAIRLNLHSLINEDLRERPAQLALSLAALREAPQMVLAALADFRRRQLLPDEMLMPLVEKIRAALGDEARTTASERRQQMFEFVLRVQALSALDAHEGWSSRGVTYVDARGAEADARFLQYLARLTTAPAPHPPLIVVSELPLAALRARLAGYAGLQPGHAHEAVLETLIDAIDARCLMLHTVSGSQPVRVAPRVGASTAEPLVICVDPALTLLEGMPPSWQYVLWTLSGAAFIMDGVASTALTESAQRVRNGGARTPAAVA